MKSSTILWFLNIGTANGKTFLLLTLVLTRFTVIGKTTLDAGKISGEIDPVKQNLVNSDNDLTCVKCSSFDQDLFIKLKLEAIKSQILSKLQLKSQPNVTSQLPRELVLEALKESESNLFHQGVISSPSTTAMLSPIIKSSKSSTTSSHPSVHSRSSLASSVPSSHGYTQSLSSQPQAGKGLKSNEYTEYNNDNYESPETSDDYYGTTSEIITFPEPGMKINGHTLLELTPPSNNINSLEVTSASLWIKLRPWDSNKSSKQSSENHSINIFVFAVRNISKDRKTVVSNNETFAPPSSSKSPSSTSSTSNIYFEQIVKKKLSVSPGWKQIEIANEIQRWFSSASTAKDKLTLMVDCSGCEGKVRFVLFDSNNSPNSKSSKSTKSKQSGSNSNKTNGKEWKTRNISTKQSHSSSSSSSTSTSTSTWSGSQFRPFLVINTKPKTVKRIKRDNLPTCDTDFKHCCKQSLYVNFTELGWDNWVIAPQGYYANYCYGDCTKPLKTPDVFAYYHAYIIDRFRQVNPYASISPCCAPTRLSAMSFIYIGPRSNIVKADLPKMIVEECGCA
uniref:TGF-beta family profile domain-containing protein n=1 Tax=Tetranychus urticae TaxID=32264 RepID=T1K2C0_TETUR